MSSKDYTNGYAELIVPLLHRMINLEKLDLSLTVLVTNAFIDGNDLKQNIISYMPRLKELTFNIRSIWFDYQFNLPSNKDIQETFKDLNNMQIISCVDYFQKRKYGQCRIYSCPYKLEYYLEITNNFPGGLFKYVREVSLYDEYPFEHEFFLRIAQSFPILDKLTLNNQKRQKNKRIQNQHLSIIKYPHLIELDLAETHQDYHEPFLFDTKTCLPNNVRFLMDYLLLKKVTRNFRRNTTRTNCAKMIYVNFRNKLKFPEHLKDYFPNAIIS